MDQAICDLWANAGKRIVGRDDQGERPVSLVHNDAAPCPPPHARQGGKATADLAEALRVTKRDAFFRPSVRAEQRALRAFKQRLIEGHLLGAASGGLVDKEIDEIKERHCKINGGLRSFSPFRPSGQSHFLPWLNPHSAKDSAP
jgi:hypothetical protein